ncbi:MAG: Fe-S cluster assembly protein SufD [Deltaproteobacteria bacterium]|nr:Fe-S cluster assembly protein SufD [Deltaproteobacteria bacterium]
MGNTAKNKIIERPQIEKREVLKIVDGENFTVTKARLKALDDYNDIELPQKADHLWRYSKPGNFFPSSYRDRIYDALKINIEEGIKTEIEFDCSGTINFVRSPQFANAKVEVEDLIISSNVPIGIAVPSSHGMFEALNMAMWTRGIYIKIPKGVQLAEPLFLKIKTDENNPFVRIFIDVEDSASLSLIETLETKNRGRAVIVSEAVAGNGASFNHVQIYNGEKGDTHHYTHRTIAKRDTRYNMVTAVTGEGNLKSDLGTELAGEGANGTIRSFTILDGDSATDLHTVHHHTAPHSTSDIQFRSVLLDKARSANTGLIKVEENAVGCEAYQVARNLVLSQDAKVETIPELEILTNDVVCSHGAATGTVDKKELFYLMSRGLNENNAISLIVEGRLIETLSLLPEKIAGDILELFQPVFKRVFF